MIKNSVMDLKLEDLEGLDDSNNEITSNCDLTTCITKTITQNYEISPDCREVGWRSFLEKVRSTNGIKINNERQKELEEILKLLDHPRERFANVSYVIGLKDKDETTPSNNDKAGKEEMSVKNRIKGPVTRSQTSGKKHIPLPVKKESWRMCYTKMDAKCYCCRDNDISIDSFSTGHIVSEHNGGKIETINLRPICSSCNSSMGTNNMFRWMESSNLKGWKAALEIENLYIYIQFQIEGKYTFDNFYGNYRKWCKKYNTSPWMNFLVRACLIGLNTFVIEKNEVVIKLEEKKM